MEAIIYAIGFSVAAMILALPFIKKYENRPQTAPEPDEKEEGGGMALGALQAAYKSLNRQKAGGWGCWIPACIQKARDGVQVPAAVALTACRMTRDELAGSRFDLSGLDRAIEALESETGAGE